MVELCSSSERLQLIKHLHYHLESSCIVRGFIISLWDERAELLNQEEYKKWHRLDDRALLVDPQAVRDTLRIRLLFAVNVSDWRLSITIKCNLFEFVLRRGFVLQWPLIRCCVVEWGIRKRRRWWCRRWCTATKAAFVCFCCRQSVLGFC